MKLVKRIALGVVVLAALPFLAALFIGRTFVVEREVTINRPKAEVFEYLKHLKNQEHYSTWFLLDPAMKTSYRGVDGTEGFVMAWQSELQNVGQGEQEITRIVDGERIEVEIRFTEPFASADPAFTTTESLGENQTRVLSVYHGKMVYPTNLLCPFIAEQIGDDLAAGLGRLKEILESR